MSSTGALIEIERLPGGTRDLLVPYDVIIDGEPMARLMPGGSHAFPVEPGEHSVFMAIDWARSDTVTIDVASGDHVHLVCAPSNSDAVGATSTERMAGGLRLLWDATFGRSRYIRLWRADGA